MARPVETFPNPISEEHAMSDAENKAFLANFLKENPKHVCL